MKTELNPSIIGKVYMTNTNTIPLGILLAGPRSDCDQAKRALALIQLGAVAPANCVGYITQLDRGTDRVRLDAARQLQRAGVVFSTPVPPS